MDKYQPLFTPFSIGRMKVRNRFVMCPMGTNAANSDGTISDNRINYYTERAKGGVGMIILGAQFVGEDLTSGCIEGVMQEKYIMPKMSVLVESVHRHGAKICAQLSCGVGRNAFPERKTSPMSSSATPSALDPSVICRPMTKEDIDNIMAKFTNAAELATKCGFDAIEIHAHAGYLVDQFLSPIWDKRTDEYGGSLENRCRFAKEIVEAIRRGCDPAMPIIFRMSLDHRTPEGRTLEDSIEIMRYLESCGVDAFDVDAGSYETIDYIFPTAYLGDACMAYVTEAARKAVSVPILNAGNHTPETALQLIESGNADFVMLGRGLIADPEFPKKLREGRREDIRPCIRCNEDCIGRTGAFRQIMLSCSVNPEACQEQWFSIKPTASPKKVCVIGGGPAGLEAARVAAIAGHDVTLFEAEDRFGGQVTAAYTPSFKGQLRALITYYEVQLKKLGVKVHMNTRIEADDPRLDEFDRFIVGSGAHPVAPPIPGIDGPNVVNVVDAHRNKDLVKGENIVICGGGLSGCDSAIELAMEHGKKPCIVEMLDTLAPKMIIMNRASVVRMLAENNIPVHTGCRVESIVDGGVNVVYKDGTKAQLPADTVISAFGMRGNTDIVDALQNRFGWKVRAVGDCDKIGRVGLAIRDGYFAGSTLDD